MTETLSPAFALGLREFNAGYDLANAPEPVSDDECARHVDSAHRVVRRLTRTRAASAADVVAKCMIALREDSDVAQSLWASAIRDAKRLGIHLHGTYGAGGWNDPLIQRPELDMARRAIFERGNRWYQRYLATAEAGDRPLDQWTAAQLVAVARAARADRPALIEKARNAALEVGAGWLKENVAGGAPLSSLPDDKLRALIAAAKAARRADA